MFPDSSKLAGPVKHSTPDSDTVILTCDRGLRWPALLALTGLGLFLGGIWVPVLLLYFPFYGVPCIIGAFYFAALRAEVVLSKRNGTLELRPTIPLFQARTTLSVITVDGDPHRLTWHFAHDPVFLAGQEAARITGKPLREESDPWKSSTWTRWGYNFLR